VAFLQPRPLPVVGILFSTHFFLVSLPLNEYTTSSREKRIPFFNCLEEKWKKKVAFPEAENGNSQY